MQDRTDNSADKTKPKSLGSVMLGAAFLMATSAIGPGFLTQTTVFTKQLLASFGFVILLSVVLDVFAQLNIWRILTASGKRAQTLANETIPGSGYVLAALIVFGGLAFNIGNIAGAGLGLNALFDLPVEIGAGLSALVAIAVFLFKEAGRAMDVFVKVLGVVMIVLIVYVVFESNPPIGEAAFRTFFPERIDPRAIITLVGGTVGGYITFAGAHRLIDAGISGTDSLQKVNRSALTGILLTACVRFFLFLAALGVIALGMQIADANPPASVFENAAGNIGYRLFGIVMWAASITSVIGAAFTSVSFIKTFHPSLEKKSSVAVIVFMIVSAAVFLFVGRPVRILVLAGTVNGFILPIGLAIVLLAAKKVSRETGYRHATWLNIAGWLVVLSMSAFAIMTIAGS